MRVRKNLELCVTIGRGKKVHVKYHRGDWRKVAQGLRALAALLELLSSVPSTYIWQLTTACNSGGRVSESLFWSHRDAHIN